MKLAKQFAAIFVCLLPVLRSGAQSDNHALTILPSTDSCGNDSFCVKRNYKNELDFKDLAGDLWHDVTGRKVAKRIDTGEVVNTKLRISAVPAAGYSLATGLAGLVAANATFRTNVDANTSTMVTSFTYTVRNQIILPLITSIWTGDNKYNIVTDWRYVKFPSYTYGLGGYTTISDGYLIDYSAIRLHSTLLRMIRPHMYAGIGYNMDYFYDIEEENPPAGKITDFERYELSKIVNKTEFSSGITFNYLYDDRSNPLNPEKGNFINVIYRTNIVSLGNNYSWRSLVVDARKYIPLPSNSENVLAFWTYDWFTITGQAPYLMMPNTGGDPYSNTGRGYILGRFRGNNMVYAEGEYRFGITNNGLIGGVVFANAESVTEETSGRFETIAPGWGAGIRLKLDKFSRTNVALDYGFGLNGSGGLFVNIGEVF